ncbi:jg15875 [Pararge aegeria aegeria]|uniref:Jg15875 protein n=1 Tax=Pararge aegeria aegeria TaxID=348720 RepID=A0A8S4QK03_9NEOP|nr:jg15875 [Pararge aegeria aegeria]
MPNTAKGNAYKKKYSEKDLQAAIEAVKKGMSKRAAANTFGIPRGTLQFRLHENLIKTRPGPPTVLTMAEENTTAEAVTSASANVSEENLKKWFHQIETCLKEEECLHILENPKRIFNGDETNFLLCPKTSKVLALKGTRDVYEIDNAPAKCGLTVMFTFSANGAITPPMIIYPLKRNRADIAASVPPEWGVGLSSNGWMNKDLFLQYITNVFYPYLVKENIELPIVLFVDGHKSHINFELSKVCKEMGIILIALYPNATRILQPADVAAFKPIKGAWKKGVLE